MPLLWPAVVDGGNGGLITPVSTNHCSPCVTATLSAAAVSVAFGRNGLLQSMASGAAAVASARKGGGASAGGGRVGGGGAIRTSLMYR